MGISLHTTAYGPHATALLHARIARAKAADPLRPVTVVVPANSVGVSARRALAGGELGPLGPGQGVIGLTLVTVYRLAELLGAPVLAARGRRPVSTPVVAAGIRRVLRDEPGIFGPVADHPATEEALVRAHRELSDCSPTSLDALAAAGRRPADVVRIHRAVRRLLADAWYDEADLMDAATQAVTNGSPVLGDLGTVVVHLPQAASPAAARLLTTLARVTDVEVLAGRCGVAEADADVDRALRRLGLDPTDARDAPDVPVVHGTRIVSVSDADEEVRSAVDEVVDAARAGVPLERIAILYPTADPYRAILDEQLRAAGIPSNGPAVRPLAERMLGRWLLDVLELTRHELSRPAVMDVLVGAPVLTPGGHRVPASAWERVSREAGVVRGAHQWEEKLQRFAGERRARAAVHGPDSQQAQRLEREAGAADGLRTVVGDLCERLARAGDLRSWADLARWCQDTIEHLLGDERARDAWPADEVEAAQKVEAALDRLARLDGVEPDTDLRAFRRTLELDLDADLGRVGRLGEGVLVGTPATALGVDLDVVIVLGLAEGVFPSRPREDSLLADRERELVSDELAPRAGRIHVEHRLLLAALASARERRVLVHPRGDLRRTVERAASRWLLDTCEALTGQRHLPRRGAHPAIVEVPSFAGRMAGVAFPATDQQWRLRCLEDHVRTGARIEEHPLAAGDLAFAAGLELLRARSGQGFTRFDGNLHDVVDLVREPTHPAMTWSSSRLETYATCPHAYLMRHILYVEPLEPPEETLSISPLDVGNIVHEALDTWLSEQLGAGTVPEPARVWPAPARQRLLDIAAEVCDAYAASGVTGHPLLWGRDRARILANLERFLDHDDRRRATEGLTPIATEFAFGLAGAPALLLELADGRTLAFRGYVDRVDRARDGSLVVTDYKTGSASRFQDIERSDDPLVHGSKLQLPVYGLAARAGHGSTGTPVLARYWFVSSRGGYRSIDVELDDALVDAFRATAAVLVDAYARGSFPMRPEPPRWRPYVSCRYCEPDELGTADVYRGWERLRLEPDLRDYVALVEPDALEPDVAEVGS
ncbi:MAG TPA: PD-(D/E)XK nuclease family protein [Nitriliruptorales bacterium]